MANNMVIGIGNTGSRIVKEILTSSTKLNDVTLYAIDSVTNNVDLNDIGKINVLSIISDAKSGSGRSRERGSAMYQFHEDQGLFNDMYETAVNAKSPVIVITSAAGGTGSGATVPCCETLLKKGVQVIPIVICPNKDDPTAYHLNANDLFIELAEIGIQTYCIFENRKGDADYGPVNREVVSLLEIIFGRKYGVTDKDSIDDSDLDVILNTPGRFIAVSAEANSIPALQKEITRKVLTGFQPAWDTKDISNHTVMTAYSLTSMFADTDFKTVFSEINSRLDGVFDEYRNICNDDNDGVSEATLIVAGLPRADVKIIDTEYKDAGSIGDGMNRSKRPSFINKKKASVINSTGDGSSNNQIKKFSWK